MRRFPYKSGDALAICDRCGFQFMHSQLQETWDGLLVDAACFEERHPQDFIRGVPERIAIRDPRPPGTDHFLSAGDVTPDDL